MQDRGNFSIAPYGTWKSPLTAARVTAGTLRFDHIVLERDNVYWIEGRASEAGRNVVVRRTRDGAIRDVTPAGFNARTRVHEYGGAAAHHRRRALLRRRECRCASRPVAICA